MFFGIEPHVAYAWSGLNAQTLTACLAVKRMGKVAIWNSLHSDESSNSFRGASSLQQLLRVADIEEG